ncbi:MAG: S-layer homology domain-containing protein [Clostridiaceae bacterium]|nr:S-layer homology domain-containing protein [Clostridiaceae bacterium]
MQFDKKINDLGIKGSIIRTTKEIAMSGAMHRQEIKLNDKTNSQVVNYKYIPMYIKHYYDKFGIYKNKNIPGSQIIKKIGTGSENKYTNSGEAEFTEAIIGGYEQFGIPILWGPEKPLRAGVNYSIDPESITLLAKDVYFTEDLVIQSLEKKASGSSTIDLSNLVRIEKSDGYETSVNLFLGGSYANEVGSGYEQTGNITIELNNGKNYRIDCKRYINYYIVKYNIMETELETINGMGNVFLTTKSPKFYTTAVVKIPCGIIFEAEITDIDPFNQQASTNVVASLDPNDIIGPEGFGEENMIKDEETLDYKIRFENDAQKALSPAQKVCIEQELDKNLDLSTFRLGSFGFGQHIFEVPENRTYYQKRIDLREEMGLYLNVNAGIDVMSGKAFWLFESIDPETGRTPEDPLRGFLPVNLKDSEGEGFVTYTIKPAKNLKTSERVEAQAVIVFDRNEPIDTPLIFNTVDCGNPVSSVKKLPEETNTNEINIEWNSMDDQNGSGVKGVDLYISKNDSDYTLLESGIKENRYKYKGDNGNKYSFFSIARDNVGNVEEMKNSGEASTKVFIPDETEENTLIENPENITEGGGGTDTTPTSTSAPTSTPKPTSKDSSKSSSAGSNKSSSSTSTSTTPVDNDALQKETGSTEKTAVPEVTKPVTIEETKEAIPAVGIFSDLKNHWAEKFVAALIEKRIIEGYPDGTIKPDANLSRSEAVVLLVRALGLEQKDSGDIAFSDLSEIPQWSRGFVKTAFDKGIIKGYGNNTFRPLNSVTREEIIVMLMNAFGYEQLKETEELYKDGSEISAWARGYVSAASKLKIIRGYEDNTLRPDSTVTRAEVFTMINNCLELNNQPQ